MYYFVIVLHVFIFIHPVHLYSIIFFFFFVKYESSFFFKYYLYIKRGYNNFYIIEKFRIFIKTSLLIFAPSIIKTIMTYYLKYYIFLFDLG
jgi:hypothetical protein